MGDMVEVEAAGGKAKRTNGRVVVKEGRWTELQKP